MTHHNDVGPLIAGFDPTNASADAIAILTNPELIKVSQDATGVQGRKLVPRPLSALPSQGDAVVIDACSSSGNTTSAGAGVPKSQGWAWGWPYAGRLGLNAFVVAAGTSDPVPLCLSVSNLTDRDSGRAMLLLDECVAPTAAAAMPSSTTSGRVGNQTFVFNETTHAIVHADSGLCVSKSSYFGKTGTTVNSNSNGKGVADGWWTHLSGVGLHPYGNCYTSFNMQPSTTVAQQVAQCSATCTSNSSCFGWNVIKVTPDSGKTVPECSMFLQSALSAPWYRSDHNFECGTKAQITPNKPQPGPSPGPPPEPAPPPPPPSPSPSPPQPPSPPPSPPPVPPPPQPPSLEGALVLSACQNGEESQQWFADVERPAMLQNGGNLSQCLSVKNRGEVWFGPLEHGDVVCLLLNRFESPQLMTCPFAEIGACNVSSAVDLWTGEKILAVAEGVQAVVPPHGTVVYRISSATEQAPHSEANILI